jgi:hypothetical protein
MSSGMMLLHDNARPNAAARTQAMLQEKVCNNDSFFCLFL